jgi:hypothetical protein
VFSLWQYETLTKKEIVNTKGNKITSSLTILFKVFQNKLHISTLFRKSNLFLISNMVRRKRDIQLNYLVSTSN